MKSWILLLALGIASCGNHYSIKDSEISGHFENFSLKELEAYKNKQTIIPEYEPSQGIIIGHKITERSDKFEFLVDILKKGQLWIYLPEERNTVNEDNNKERHLKAFVPQFLERLKKTYNSQEYEALLKNIQPFSPTHYTGNMDLGANTSIWARDWAPFFTYTQGGRLRALDLNYKKRVFQDAAPEAFSRWWENDSWSQDSLHRVNLPLYNEGGNFMVDSDKNCFMVQYPLEPNISSRYNNYNHPMDQYFSLTQIEQMHKDYFGCKTVRIIKDPLPLDSTRHIDLWAKFLGPKIVAISELKTEQKTDLDKYFHSHFTNIQNYLNKRAQDFTAWGYKVVRLPLPTPDFKYKDSESSEYDGIISRSYMNSLIYNKRKTENNVVTFEKTIYIPQFKKPANYLWNGKTEYNDKHRLEKYEKEITTILEKEGFHVFFVPADDLIWQGGAIHCITMQVPDWSEKDLKRRLLP